MKTIEERADEFVNILMSENECSDLLRELLKETYIAAATDERALLTEWHDPKTEHPYLDSTVLIKYEATSDSTVVLYQTTRYLVMPFVGPRFEFETDSRIKSGLFKIVGWRYIHEND